MTPKKQQAIDQLRSTLSRGERLFIVKRWQSRDGSYQTVDVYRADIRSNRTKGQLVVDRFDEQIFAQASLERITDLVCDATGFRYDAKHKALGVGSCHPSEVSYHVVRSLGQALYSDSYAFEVQEI